ncbi:MAG: hypothetical protein F4Z13_03000 [Candidatus Dadabacteria bacterium]|nr:hypothetical protein [Candidatus Dadabacteria bacterium]
MENRVFSRFNIYDQFGYLLVGGIALMCVAFDLLLLEKLDSTLATSVFSSKNFLVLFPLAYFVGHLVQAMANIVIKENKASFSDSEKKTLEEAKKYFEAGSRSLQEIYQLCYMLSFAKDITGQVQTFNAYYGLYRGWKIVFGLNSLFMLYLVARDWFSLLNISILAISIIMTWLIHKRSKRFYSYSRRKTLETFTILSKGKL